MRRIVSFLLFFLVAGCAEADPESIGVDVHLSEYPEHYCALQAKCYPERYRDLYNDELDACVEAASGPVERKVEDDSCSYDGVKAAESIDYIETLDCDAWEADEDDVCAVSTICSN